MSSVPVMQTDVTDAYLFAGGIIMLVYFDVQCCKYYSYNVHIVLFVVLLRWWLPFEKNLF
jgi:hypothetical protein